MANTVKTPKVAELSAKSKEVLATLRANEGGLTVAELKEMGIDGVNSSHLSALVDRGLVSAEKVVVEVVTKTKREVNRYTPVKSE